MKNITIERTCTPERISTDSNTSVPEFPFQLTEQNYHEKTEFIKNSLHEIGLTEESISEDQEISQREFNSNFASLQSWFIRISHKEKLSYVLKLLNMFSVVLKRNTNLLVDILGPISKDFIYAKTQYTFSKYDMTPLDNNRCLADIPLAEAKTNSLSWFSELQEKEQVRVMIILLNLSGSVITFHFYFKAVKYLDHKTDYDLLVIEEKLKDFKFYNNMMNKKESTDLNIIDFKSNVSPIFHVSSNISQVNSETKNLETDKKEGSTTSLTSSTNGMTALDYEHKLVEWEKEFRALMDMSGLLKSGNLSEIALPVIDMLQLLPISVNRYIYTFLDHRSKKHLRLINKYWSKSSVSIRKEENTRHSLDQAITMLDFKSDSCNTKDFYSEVKYVQPKKRDKERSLPGQESKRPSTKRQSTVSINSTKRSPSATSILDKSLFKPKYSIKMTPTPNHQYTKKYPKNPYKGRFIISEIYSRFDHTRCIAANYQWVAMSNKSNITLHSLLTGAPNPCQLIGHTGYVTVLCFHPSKNCLFSGSCDTTVKYWDIYSRKIIATYSNHKSLITDLNVNENHLASVSMDQTLRIFNIESGYMVWQYLFSCSPVAVTLGRKLEVYLGVEDGSVFRTDLESHQTPEEWEATYAHEDKITCIVFDEPFLVTGGDDGYVMVWRFEHFEASAVATFDHDGLCVTGVALSFMKVLTTAIDGILRIWDVCNSRLKREIVVNIARTPIISMICMEINDHTKVIINSEDSIKVIEFKFYWINFSKTCLTKENREPKFVRGLERITTIGPDDVLMGSEPQLKIVPKDRFEKRCRELLLLRHATLPDVVKPSKGDKVTFKEVPIFSDALLDNDLLLFPRVLPEAQKMPPHVVKNEILEGGTKILSALQKYLPMSTKGVLPGYNPSKITM